MPAKLYNPDYLQSLCQKYGLKPSRKYGQNFLVNPEVIEKIIGAADIKKTDTIVEVGPGFGVLTFALAEKAKNVLAYEIEKKLAPYWEKYSCHCEAEGRGNPINLRTSPLSNNLESHGIASVATLPRNDNVYIIWGNVLRELSTFNSELRTYKVVANLPYQITSAVIRFFLENDNPPESMTLMVQKEVAERICAKKGDMSLLAVSVQFYAEPKIIAIVPRTNFWPEPKVDSAILHLSLRAPAPRRGPLWGGGEAIPRFSEQGNFVKGGIASVATLPRNDNNFFRLVKAGFANRRKLLIKNLEPFVGKQNRDKLKQIFAELGLSETARAQELDVEDWINMMKMMATSSPLERGLRGV